MYIKKYVNENTFFGRTDEVVVVGDVRRDLRIAGSGGSDTIWQFAIVMQLNSLIPFQRNCNLREPTSYGKESLTPFLSNRLRNCKHLAQM